MSGHAVRRATSMLQQHRQSILQGTYPTEQDLERLGRLLARIAPESLPPLSKLLARNLELLSVARDALQVSEPGTGVAMQTYGPDGRRCDVRAASQHELRR